MSEYRIVKAAVICFMLKVRENSFSNCVSFKSFGCIPGYQPLCPVLYLEVYYSLDICIFCNATQILQCDWNQSQYFRIFKCHQKYVKSKTVVYF